MKVQNFILCSGLGDTRPVSCLVAHHVKGFDTAEEGLQSLAKAFAYALVPDDEWGPETFSWDAQWAVRLLASRIRKVMRGTHEEFDEEASQRLGRHGWFLGLDGGPLTNLVQVTGQADLILGNFANPRKEPVSLGAHWTEYVHTPEGVAKMGGAS